MSEDPIPPFSADVLEGIAEVLGATEGGLTGSQIATHLGRAKVPDVNPEMTKRLRLFNALAARQNQDKVGNCVVAFIISAMAPVRFRNKPAEFTRLQGELDEVLIHAGLRITEEGKVGRAKAGKATTLNQAAERAGTIVTELRRRNTHPDLMRYCTLELLQKNNFHALLEAAKSIPDRIRVLTGFTNDGAGLIDDTLTNASGPVLAINDGLTATDHSEQSGFANLAKGLLGLYRNPTAHDPKLRRDVTDTELVDALTAMSMVHQRLDDAVVKP
ncbi:MAG: TIGR02391 family protein [bacterium]|nr:TIGR02391 family protein [bacterium]